MTDLFIFFIFFIKRWQKSQKFTDICRFTNKFEWKRWFKSNQLCIFPNSKYQLLIRAKCWAPLIYIICINLQKHLNDKRFSTRYLLFIFSLNISMFYHGDDDKNGLLSNFKIEKASKMSEVVWNISEFNMKSRYWRNDLINWAFEIADLALSCLV